MIAAGTLSDPELLALIRAGDDYAFAAVYEAHRRVIYQFVYRFLKTPELAQDMAQEVFI